MKKTLIILLTAILTLSLFISCEGDIDSALEAKITITFNANGGTPATKTQKVGKGIATALDANSFTSPDENYVFAGWTTDAAGEKTYYGDKESVTLTGNITLYAQWGSPLDSGSTTTWTAGKYTLENDVSISGRINVNGNVKLFIPNGKTLTASKGITVTGTNSLTINGDGSLIAGGTETPENEAGIGGVSGEAGGTVTIKGGTVTANGGEAAAGIGGGRGGAGGTVTINGGTVTANGGSGAAGIGRGYEAGNDGKLTIGYAEIQANSLVINSGWSLYYGDSENPTDHVDGLHNANDISYYVGRYMNVTQPAASKVTITFKANGGTGDDKTQEITSGVETKLNINEFTAPPDKVFAGWTTDAAGEKTYYGDKESVTLTGNITLYAQWGIDFNNLADKYAWENGKTYTITNDLTLVDSRITVSGTVKLFLNPGKTLTVSKGIKVTGTNSLTINGDGSLIAGGTATPEGAAGIGSGDGGAGGTVTINGGTVTATGGKYGAGIGGGAGPGGTVTINGGIVTANGGLTGAGIGGGGLYGGGTVTINGGTVTANGGEGAVGIGAGSNSSSLSDGTLTIGTGVHVYKTGSESPYADGPQDNVTTRYQNMTVNNYN